MGSYLFLLLLLACPLAMIFMMRGMHGGQGRGDAGGGQDTGAGSGHGCGSAHDHGHSAADPSVSIGELRRRREQLDREIEEREAEERTWSPVSGGRR